ncbi:MAG: right-handed parallel beta-helix repeat-containing protein [Anaerolineales bacterium]|nr:right-handed parallel beta-helix repeat-containing protein [Anaerolineales bacterium]
MKGDFSRLTFDPRKHYRGVLMQQGRVQLDSDWNENLESLLHRIETEAIDVIGACGVPIHEAAFGVVTDFATLSQEERDLLTELGLDALDPGDFYLTRGRAYLDGILVENDKTLPFSQQPAVLPQGGGAIDAEGIFLLYLDVWLRHLTALEDPAIREVALGGPDTTTRSQVVWQAVLEQVGEVGEPLTCADDLSPWPDPSTGMLRARTHPEDVPTDPCSVAPGAGYKRLENQLYRVEIHKGSGAAGGPTFKWSRDNGSVVVAVSQFAVDGATTKIRTTSLGRDDVLGLHENDWVEVLDDATELAGQPGTLVKITRIDPDNILTLSGSVTGYDLNGHPRVRRWDSEGETLVSIPAENDGYLKLEGGVEIKFTLGSFRTGDYWLIPARTVPGQFGEIEWPQQGTDPAARLPLGIQHHTCKLAVITAEMVGGVITITNVDDCRRQFPPLTELPAGGRCCCSVSVGEGGDYPDLQSALDARPEAIEAYRVCLLPGAHHPAAPVIVENQRSLIISGCGPQTMITGSPGEPVLKVHDSRQVRIENLWISASAREGAILFGSSREVAVSNCWVRNRVLAEDEGRLAELEEELEKFERLPAPVIVVDDCEEVEIHDNLLQGFPAIQADGQELTILRNRIRGGGIRVSPPSLLVRIEDNTILRGMGPGIQLGGGDKDINDYQAVRERTREEGRGADYRDATRGRNPLAALRFVTIAGNLIGSMHGSGILTEESVAGTGKLGDVEFLEIRDNQIIECCEVPDVLLSDHTRVGGGIALIGVFSTRIRDNFIAANGSGHTPACGIFVLDGSGVDILDNTVVENGGLENTPEPDSYQAGIAVQYVFGNALELGELQGGELGYPALRVCGNQVVCPAGQALTVTAMGDVLVEGNTLVSRATLHQPTDPLDFGEKAGCVHILDLGLPIWMQDIALLLTMLANRSTQLHFEGFQQLEQAEIGFPNGRLMFHDNQVVFRSALLEQVESLGELDDQWMSRAWEQAFLSTLLMSLDDVSLSGSQFQADVPAYALIGWQKVLAKEIPPSDLLAYALKFIHAASLGTIIRATGNGLTERLYANSISYASNASQMNITTSNEATHAFLTDAPKRVEEHNLSLTT